MRHLIMRTILTLVLTALIMGAMTLPSKAAPTQPTVVAPVVKIIDVDYGWTSATVWYSKKETKRIVAGNGACSVVVGKVPGWVAKVLSGSCGIIGVWAGYALARDRCVGVKVSYFLALPYKWMTRSCS